MKKLSLIIAGCTLLITTAQTAEQSPDTMEWSPTPSPDTPSLKPSPTILSPESIAAAGLPPTTHAVLATPSFNTTPTYSEHELYGARSGIILRIPTSADAELSICSLLIKDHSQRTVSFNASGVLEWNTEHLACIEAARKAHAY